MTNPPVDVVLPCLNEAAALPWVLSRMPAGYRAIVVDNGSHDGSADVARSLGAIVVDEPRRGFGAACHAGLLHATSAVVCFMDADASLDPRQLPSVAEPVIAGAADIALGRRVAETRLALAATRSSCECGAGATDPGAHRMASCATSARCAQPDVSRFLRLVLSIAGSDTRSRWCCARRLLGGE